MMILKMLILTLLVVFIIDLSGIIEELEVALAKWLKVKKVRIPKPFSCSLCSTWWLLLVMLLIEGRFTLIMIGLSGLFAYLTPVFYQLLLFVKEVGFKIVDMLFWIMGGWKEKEKN